MSFKGIDARLHRAIFVFQPRALWSKAMTPLNGITKLATAQILFIITLIVSYSTKKSRQDIYSIIHVGNPNLKNEKSLPTLSVIPRG